MHYLPENETPGSFLKDCPDDPRVVQALDEIRKESQRQGQLELSSDVAQVKSSVMAKVQESHELQKSLESPYSRSDRSHKTANFNYTNKYFRTAFFAVAALLVAVSGISLKTLNSRNPSSGATVASASVYTTPRGQRANVTLPDGTLVILNVGSRLEVPADFGRDTRQVTLSGEAVFTVIHQNESPFSVAAGGTVTKVLGTVFSVRKYASDHALKVSVKSGRVSVGVTPVSMNEAVSVSASGAILHEQWDESRFGFVDGTLILKDISLSEAIVELGRWYDAEIRIAEPSLAYERVGGTFRSGSKNQLVTLLREAFELKVVEKDNMLIIYEGNSN